MSEINDAKFLNFNFDVSAYRLLGRELITDRITALFEIVKNAYDANANCVEIEFINTSPRSSKSKMIIKDDGLGMTLVDIEKRWMVIGTSSKRRDRTSPEPYYRKVVGKKGIGRFAVDLLGSKLTLKTKKKDSPKWTLLETDWSKYYELEATQLLIPFESEKEYFTDVKNKYWFQDGNPEVQGTILEIEQLNDEWTQNEINRAYKELAKLVSPSHFNNRYPFAINIKSEFDGFKNVFVKPLSVVEFSTLFIELKYHSDTNQQEIVLFENGKLEKKLITPPQFGGINYSLYYFDQNAKRKFKDKFKTDIDGIKIYRDGIITTPFAETEDDQNKQKDILGIDKRRYSGFFEKLNSRDLLGFVELADERNPYIIEATNRQDFIDNAEWKGLKQFIIDPIVQLEKLLKHERDNVRKITKSDLGVANEELKSVKQTISNLKKEASPEVKVKLQNIEADLGRLQGTVNKGIREYAKLEAESKQKENLFFSLVSLQTYAAMFSHMTKHTIGHVIRDAEYFNNYFPNEKLNDRFILISKRVYSEFLNLRNGVDFMLKYAKSDDEFEEIDLGELIEKLFNIYGETFYKEAVDVQLEFNKTLILTYNRKALEDIFDNLISNSIKALKGEKNKKIRCSGIIDRDQIVIYFSDNGIGINDEDKYRVFDIFFTKTPGLGGAGIGLYMVKTRIEAMQGTIEVVDNEFKPNGATIKITLPFNK